MIKVYTEGNYFVAIDTNTSKVIEHPRAGVKLKQSAKDDNIFTIFYDNQTEIETSEKSFEFYLDENDLAFADQSTFRTWFRINTGESYSGGGVDLTPLVESVNRPIGAVEITGSGTKSTISGVQSVALWFRGNNGTLDGVDMPNNATPSHSPVKGQDTVGSIDFTVPTTGEQRVIISYVYTS